jgi:hypothetical protein
MSGAALRANPGFPIKQKYQTYCMINIVQGNFVHGKPDQPLVTKFCAKESLRSTPAPMGPGSDLGVCVQPKCYERKGFMSRLLFPSHTRERSVLQPASQTVHALKHRETASREPAFNMK